jgi:hypothetical protein
MPESRDLSAARHCLAEAEAAWSSADGLTRLTEGLERLTDVIEMGSEDEARTASNLAASYAGRFYGHVYDKLQRSRQVPEPELEHCFKVVLAFDQVKEALPPASAKIKIGVVKALVDRYYEGHSPAKKRAVLEQLAALERRGDAS